MDKPKSIKALAPIKSSNGHGNEARTCAILQSAAKGDISLYLEIPRHLVAISGFFIPPKMTSFSDSMRYSRSYSQQRDVAMAREGGAPHIAYPIRAESARYVAITKDAAGLLALSGRTSAHWFDHTLEIADAPVVGDLNLIVHRRMAPVCLRPAYGEDSDPQRPIIQVAPEFTIALAVEDLLYDPSNEIEDPAPAKPPVWASTPLSLPLEGLGLRALSFGTYVLLTAAIEGYADGSPNALVAFRAVATKVMKDIGPAKLFSKTNIPLALKAIDPATRRGSGVSKSSRDRFIEEGHLDDPQLLKLKERFMTPALCLTLLGAIHHIQRRTGRPDATREQLTRAARNDLRLFGFRTQGEITALASIITWGSPEPDQLI